MTDLTVARSANLMSSSNGHVAFIWSVARRLRGAFKQHAVQAAMCLSSLAAGATNFDLWENTGPVYRDDVFLRVFDEALETVLYAYTLLGLVWLALRLPETIADIYRDPLESFGDVATTIGTHIFSLEP